MMRGRIVDFWWNFIRNKFYVLTNLKKNNFSHSNCSIIIPNIMVSKLDLSLPQCVFTLIAFTRHPHEFSSKKARESFNLVSIFYFDKKCGFDGKEKVLFGDLGDEPFSLRPKLWYHYTIFIQTVECWWISDRTFLPCDKHSEK